MKKYKKHKHSLCRPPEGAISVLALLDDGTWVEDDGKPHLAFSGKDKRDFPYAWAVDCGYRLYDTCPYDIAMYFTSKRFGCANGEPRPHWKADKFDADKKEKP